MGAPRAVRTGPVPDLEGGPDSTPDGGFAEVSAITVLTDRVNGSDPPVQADAVDRVGVRSWPLLLLALPAAVAVWSGWVGIGQLTGFGQVHPLPGIWSSLHIDSAVTLPVGVEAYAAYALHAWLAGGAQLTRRTRRFAKWSAIGSLLLGMAGQVAYHLLTQAGAMRAPWGVTTAVACLPVLMLGMAAGLAHMIRADTDAARHVAAADGVSAAKWSGGPAGGVSAARLAEVRAAGARLAATGQRISRRSLRAVGVHGSNAELGALARAMGSVSGQGSTAPQ
jgi:hypothetical protein